MLSAVNAGVSVAVNAADLPGRASSYICPFVDLVDQASDDKQLSCMARCRKAGAERLLLSACLFIDANVGNDDVDVRQHLSPFDQRLITDNAYSASGSSNLQPVRQFPRQRIKSTESIGYDKYFADTHKDNG